MVKTNDPCVDLINSYKSEIIKNEDELVELAKMGPTIDKNLAYLVLLKKWNSITPKFPLHLSDQYRKELEKQFKVGGGFFLNIFGYGLVIDPGYGFFDIFYQHGFVPKDINGILITHAHEDHCGELEAFFSILFKIFKCKNNDNKKKKFDLYLNKTTFLKYETMLINDRDYVNVYTADSITNEFPIKKIKTKVKFLNVFHKEMPWYKFEDESKGIKIILDNKFSILYSGDTEWKKDLSLNFEGDYDIAIFNIGKLCEKNSNLTENHLGLLGIKNIIEENGKINTTGYPKYIIISEWGLELKKIRNEICKTISDITREAFVAYEPRILNNEATIFIGFGIKDSGEGRINTIERISFDVHYTSDYKKDITERINHYLSIINSNEPDTEFREIYSFDEILKIIKTKCLPYKEWDFTSIYLIYNPENIYSIAFPKNHIINNKNHILVLKQITFTSIQFLTDLDAKLLDFKDKEELINRILLKKMNRDTSKIVTILIFEKISLKQN